MNARLRRRGRHRSDQRTGRPASRWVHLPFAAVCALVVIGLVRVSTYNWREGSAWIALAMLVAAVLRAVLRSEHVGLLAIRSRPVDAVIYAGFGVILLYLALTIVGGPLA
jgi:hypothetical protein